ncbi:MAG: sugar phosphate isomerase/epimerase family protein [Cytophagaceae bacterium]
MNRRKFINAIGKTSLLAITPGLLQSCFHTESESKKLKLSLAEWSLHESLFNKKISNLDFPKVASGYGIHAVEYVSQFFQDKAKDIAYLKELKKIADSEGVYNHLIMVDLEGSLASSDTKERTEAVENHYKWVDAAKELDCKSIRVNLHGECTEEEWLKNSIDGLGKLAEYGAKNKINVIVENHGQWSSKGYLVAEVMKQINSPYCGTLPDFGNFCVKRRDGDLWVSPCIETYDMYKGVEEMLPYAKGVSAKTFAFDAEGNESTIDFAKMFSLMKASGFEGYVGVEYEGGSVSEDEGIRKTKALIEKYGY